MNRNTNTRPPVIAGGLAFEKEPFPIMKANYHTHTQRCKHAFGTEEMYIQSAIRAGFDTLGFADHTPWPYQSGFVSPIRMEPSELPGYVTTLRELKERYSDRLNVLIGLECEYFPRYMDWLKEAKEAYNLDYLIFGAHYIGSEEDFPYVGYACRDTDVMFRYADMCVQGMQTGLYAYLAHPDLFMRRRGAWDDDCIAAAKAICGCALSCGLPLEYNLNAHVIGGEECLFPRREFWELAAKMGNSVVIGYDAHQPQLLEDAAAEAEIRALLKSLCITPLGSIDLQLKKPQPCGQLQGGLL